MSTPPPPGSPDQLSLLQGLESLEGQVESVVYADASPFFVCRVRVGGRRVTVTGQAEPPQVAQSYRFLGKQVEHPSYGQQFEAHWFEALLPTTARGIEGYLGSGQIKGVGRTLAKRLVEHFGEQTLEVIEHAPERLIEVPRLRAEVRARLVEAMRAHHAARRVLLYLASFGITPALGNRIYRALGPANFEVVQRNPYRLAEDVAGIGFRIADRVAQHLGRTTDDPHRLEAGLLHALRTAQDAGHLFLPAAALLEQAASLLEASPAALEPALERAVVGGKIVSEDDACYLPHLFALEVRIATQVQRRCSLPPRPEPAAEQLDAVEQQLGGLALAAQQRECLRQALGSGMFIITGGPGTGKTTTLRSLLCWWRVLGLRVSLAAPTGRAARRMAEATGEEARTLHRLLEYAPGERTFRRNQEHPLQLDVLVVDEASMVDAWIFGALLEALPSAAHLVLVGDVDQLPSVGAGSVLRDLIECAQVPVVFLEEIFRQAQDSCIVRNAHRIQRGLLPEKGPPEGDYFFIEEENPERVADIVLGLCTHRLPAYYGFDAIEDVQVIAPMYKGGAGVLHLNTRLQEALNPLLPGQPSVPVQNGRARVGDKVMQIRNNYERGIFNGDMAIIRGLDESQEMLYLELLGSPAASSRAASVPSTGEKSESASPPADRAVVAGETGQGELPGVEPPRPLPPGVVACPLDDAHELALAYACSVHKSQGSEFPAVVLPLVTQHFVMLQRNLLYTALTRARRLAVLVGSRRALAMAVGNERVERRYTRLAQRIREARPQPYETLPLHEG